MITCDICDEKTRNTNNIPINIPVGKNIMDLCHTCVKDLRKEVGRINTASEVDRGNRISGAVKKLKDNKKDNKKEKN